MIKLDDNFFDFIKAHRGEDVVKLRLRFGGTKADEQINLALDHLACEAKAGHKFDLPDGSSWMPRLMLNPLSVEQASSAHVSLERAKLISTGLKILDMTCGLGMDIRGFLTRNPIEITGFELNSLSAEVAQYNFADYPNVKIIEGDSVEHLHKIEEDRYDLIYIDPARRDKSGGRVYNLHDCAPDLIEILPTMLQKSKMVMAKLSPMLDVSQTIADLQGVSHIIAVEEKGECKELLAVIERGFVGDAVVSVGLEKDALSFTINQEREANVVYGDLKSGQYLHVPGPAAMKAGCFKLMSSRFENMTKVAPNSHLYVSDKIHENFPGKHYLIDEVVDFSSSNIKKLVGQYKNGDITVRNFPLSAMELQKKLKLKPGNDHRIFATTDFRGKKVLIISTTA